MSVPPASARRSCGRALVPLVLGTALAATVATAAPAQALGSFALPDLAPVTSNAVIAGSTLPTVPLPVQTVEPAAGLTGPVVASAVTAATAPAPVFTPLNAAGLATAPTALVDWAPDGSRMVYASGSVVTSVRADGSSPMTVSTSLNVNALAWSGRGARIAMSGSEAGKAGDLPQLWITTPLGLKAYKVTAPGVTGHRTTSVTWLDGVTLVVAYGQTGTSVSRLAVVTLQDPAASTADLVPDDPSAVDAATSLLDPAGSPNGTSVAYRQQVPDGAGGTVDSIWVVGRHGTGAHKVAEAPSLGRPVWSADGRTIYVQQVGASIDVLAVPAAGGTAATALVSGVTAGQVLARIPVPAGRTIVRRLTGRTAVDTSVTASWAVWPTLPAARGATTAAAVVLVNVRDWPGAAVAGPLAAAKQGPVLLSQPKLGRRTAIEIRRILAPRSTVYLVGNAKQLTPALVRALVAMHYRVVRYSGADPYATAVTVAVKGLGKPRSVVFASRGSWQDSMVASAAAGRLGAALLFTGGTVQARSSLLYVRAVRPTVSWAIGRAAVKAVPSARPAAGSTPGATSLAAARAIFLPPSAALLGSAAALPDTIVAATTAARLGEPLLLTAPTALGPQLTGYLDASSGSVNQVWLFGRPTVPTAAVLTAATALAGGRIR